MAAFVADLAPFAFIFLNTTDLSSIQAGAYSLELFFAAIVLSLKPTGLSLVEDGLKALDLAEELQETGLQYVVDEANIRDHYRGMFVRMETHSRKIGRGLSSRIW